MGKGDMQFISTATNPLDVLADMKGCTVPQLLQMTRLVLDHIDQTVIPEEISLLTNVKELFISFALSRGQSSVSLPSSMTLMTGLTKLSIEQAHCLAFPSIIFELTQLRDLAIKNCGLSSIPPGLSQLALLESLDMSHNYLLSIPSDVGCLQSIHRIDFSYNILALQENSLCDGKSRSKRNDTINDASLNILSKDNCQIQKEMFDNLDSSNINIKAQGLIESIMPPERYSYI